MSVVVGWRQANQVEFSHSLWAIYTPNTSCPHKTPVTICSCFWLQSFAYQLLHNLVSNTVNVCRTVKLCYSMPWPILPTHNPYLHSRHLTNYIVRPIKDYAVIWLSGYSNCRGNCGLCACTCTQMVLCRMNMSQHVVWCSIVACCCTIFIGTSSNGSMDNIEPVFTFKRCKLESMPKEALNQVTVVQQEHLLSLSFWMCMFAVYMWPPTVHGYIGVSVT